MSAYNYFTIKALKEELKKYDAKVSGRKADLIARLEFYKKNQQTATPLQAEFSMDLPNYDSFMDIHAGMLADIPPLSEEKIAAYLLLFNKCLENKCKDLYRQRFLRYVRVSKDNDKIYFTSVVWAEMKKQVVYKVDACLSTSGVVLEAQCECGAGQGPTAHCKHVVVLLYGICRFLGDAEIITEQTCTQVLQSFHRAKAYNGSPIKSSDIQKRRGKGHFDFDPRSQEHRNREGKIDYIRNLCVNYQIDKNMPVMQLFCPANPLAITLDHDYLELSDVDEFLKKSMISSITEDEIIKIENDTRGQGRNKLWRAERQKRLTASNFGRIFKATSRTDMDRLARSLSHSKDILCPAIMHGRRFESVAAEQFEKLFTVKSHECGLFVYKEHPVLAASPDRIINSDTLLEIKCPYASRDKVIDHITVPYLEKFDDGFRLNPNHDYYYQVQGQLLCTNMKQCHFVIYTFKDLRCIEIERDDAFIHVMVNKLINFYKNYFRDAIVNRLMYSDYFEVF